MEILYIMHVNWGWIKQRPQFIAELLANKNKVSVVYAHRYRGKDVKSNSRSLKKRLTFYEVYTTPGKLKKFKFFQLIDDYIFKIKINKLINKKKPKAIYITYPYFINYIPSNYKGKIIYDCMDDYYSMTKEYERKALSNAENKLIRRATNVLFSSKFLSNTIQKRYELNLSTKSKIIRNGFIGPVREIVKDSENKKEFAYFGTISSWFDFSVIEKSLQDFPEITYKIIGPISPELKNIPHSNRIKFVGSVQHEELYEEVKDCCALIMPFRVNEIIKAVDPVKLYEYINFNKNIICVRYNEILRFNKFVYFYNSYEEFKKSIKLVLNDLNTPKYSLDERNYFLEKNKWQCRVEDIEKILSNQ